MLRKTVCLVALLAASSLWVGACMSSSAREYLEGQAHTSEAPPEPMDEAIPPAPEEEMAWTEGYWYRADDRFVWVPGRWEFPPVPGHVWVRAGWVEDSSGFRFAPGYWAPASHQPRHQFVWKWLPARRGANEPIMHPQL